MTPRPFEPKFMKMSVLTAALQELTPRRIRDEDPDRAIEDWLEFSRELDCPNIQLSAALHPTETDVPPEAMLDPVANTLDLRKPFERNARQARARGHGGDRGRHHRYRVLRQPAPRRRRRAEEEARVRRAHDGRRRDARRQGGLRLRRTKPEAVDGPEPPLLRGGVHPAAQGSQGARHRISRRAVPDARLDGRRQLAQQHRLHAGHVDRAASDLREARRRRSVPRPLRSVARDPDGAGYALDFPVPEGQRLRLHRRAAFT